MQLFNLKYLDEISAGDNNFKKELIEIFLEQVPEFVTNIKKFYAKNDLKNLGKEAHTATSSVLIFGMNETGNSFKKIQNLAEINESGTIPTLIQKVESELEIVTKELNEMVKEF